MPDAAPCPQCGRPLAAEIPGGLCPECLLAGGLNPTTASPPASQTPGILTPEELASSFPELKIEALVGFGGMGAVYRARQIKLDRQVALKVIHPEAAKDVAFAERFEREARAMAQLSHPHIVTIHDFDRFELTHDGDRKTLFYILMEYVDGSDLRNVMDQHQLTSSQALSIVQQVCEALQFAHDAGVVHRDIKPENILIDQQGMTRIADFGLAKLAEGAQHNYTLTGTHQVVGTPRYMAPEQLEGGKAIDHRADLYSLGVVFYEMLTGELPLGHFDLPSASGAVDERLDEVVLRTLAKEPGKRYQQASEFRDDVRALSETPVVPPVRPPQRELEQHKRPVPTHQVESQPDIDSAATSFYGQILLIVAGAGVVAAFLPWSRVQFGSLTSGDINIFALYGYQYLLPLIASLASAFVVIYSYVLWLNHRRLDATRALLAIGAGGLLVCMGIVCIRAVPILAINSGRPTWVDNRSWMTVRQALSQHYSDGNAQVEVFTQIGPGFAITVGMLMILISVWELTTVARFHRSQGEAETVSPLVLWLRRGVWIHWIALVLCASIFAYWGTILPGGGRAAPLFWNVFFAGIAQFIGCLCVTPLMWMAADRLEKGHSRSLVQVASVLCMLPLGPGALISIPVGIWLWNMLHSDPLQHALERPLPQYEVQEHLGGIARWLTTIGLAQLLLWIAITILAPSSIGYSVNESPPWAMILLPVLLMLPMVVLNAVLWSSGRSMLKSDDGGQRTTALLLGVLPLGPGWFVSFPLSIAGFSLLRQLSRKPAAL